MVLQELVQLLPNDPGTVGLIVAIVGSLIGVGIWLTGARFSRPIITLMTVLLGASVGMHLPQWFGWEISGAGPAVGAALVLGVTGYALHGLWVGVGLGTVLSSWVALACWITFRNGATWSWPEVTETTTAAQFLHALWTGLPPDVSRILPYACATAMVTGLGLTIIWPKASLAIGWSMAGVTLLTCMGIAAMDFGRPELLARLPRPVWAQTTLLGLLVILGALVQWKLSPRLAGGPGGGGKKKSKKKSNDHDHDHDDDFDDDD